MLLQLSAEFDLQSDVVPWLLAQGPAAALDIFEKSAANPYIVNVERNGKIIYTWKGSGRNTCIGLYDPLNKQNEHLYTFEKDLHIISCSINNEKTLLVAVSFLQSTKEERVNQLLQPVSKCLTLVIEIHPVNNVRVLKAVDTCIRVQFLYPVANRNPFPESHLLLISEDKYIEQFHIHVVTEDHHKVVIQNSGQLPRDRVADDLIWAQWDMTEQRLFYIVPKESRNILKCVQFYPDENFNLILEAPLDISLRDTGLKFVNFGYDYSQDQEMEPRSLNLQVFTSKTGEDARINMLHKSSIQSPFKSAVWDCCSGRTFTVRINECSLMQFLWNSKLDSDRLAALHCALLHVRNTTDLEMQIIQWISENLSTCYTFNPLQEFIIASLYWTMCPETSKLDKLLPYTSLLYWNGIIPGITCITDIISLPELKVHNCKGFWEKLTLNLECVKYAEPHLHYNNNVLRREWYKLLSDEKAEERRTTTYLRNIFENAKKVLSNLAAWNLEERLVPLFQEEDYQQQLLIGLMVAQLKDHLMRHLQYVGKMKIDQIALDYVSKLLDLICRIMEAVWRKYSLQSCVLCLDERGSVAEFSAFHIMSRILEAANGMCMPLPPGFHTLHTGLGVRCLPLHTLLHYIDNGVLQLTETCATKLLKDLDNTEKNEKLKFSIFTRLPEAIGHKVSQLWNHPVNSNFIARNSVKLLLDKLRKRQHNRPVVDRLSVHVEFLPLNYLVDMLAEVEDQGLNPFEEEDNVNAKFVEETALKHTMMLLGL
ncbi:gamma-secretase-activating protein isoform X5 [Chelonia mydas]|uniref:gamma-secretase-activating protein isoform X5 n=1 Tax=Chelonia mydas TaxID=8469 RepID=UPI001CA8EFE4|nr:gamma-secretase-activating protein isoform X5 [Chelonia mydas]